MEEDNGSPVQEEKKPWYKGGLLNYKDKGSQTVISFLGYELTAPAGLKKPGIVYISFILVNLIVFLVLKGFITQ
tara:strand:+ start:660 stop:881 length:222 start_codon:yes stop_codon:yes gene_type:complete